MSTVARPAELITREGHERLTAELEDLIRHRLPAAADALRAARADGGEPGENVGISQAIEEHTAIERRIDELRALLAAVRIADPPADGTAGIGTRVRIKLAPRASPREYLLVGPLEADAARGELSIASPIGEALVGRRAGDVVTVQTPGGTRRVELLEVA